MECRVEQPNACLKDFPAQSSGPVVLLRPASFAQKSLIEKKYKYFGFRYFKESGTLLI